MEKFSTMHGGNDTDAHRAINDLRDHGFGARLRDWRTARHLSQLGLALQADISARHVSQIETGKAQASRDMVVRLADALGLPLRERNALLLAAGYAPEYSAMSLDTPEMAPIRRAIALTLQHQEPYPAFVLNRRWDIIDANAAAGRVAQFLQVATVHANMVRQFFDPQSLRAAVVNWEEIAGDLIRHLHDEPVARDLLEEALAYPGVPSRWARREFAPAPSPLLTVEFRKLNQSLRFFSTITRFGTPRDVTLDELRIECTFPGDDATAELCHALAQ
jgi:transcriptional regulator with XRE-family HTH domain